MKEHTKIPMHTIASDRQQELILERLTTLTHYDSSEPHRHNYFEFFYFQQGGGTHLIDFIEFPILSAAIHIVAPGQVHQVKRALNSEGFVFLFEASLFESNKSIENFLFDHVCLDVENFKPTYHLDEETQEEEKRVVAKAWREYNANAPLKHQVVSNQLAELILYCMREKEKRHPSIDIKHHSVYMEFRRLLNKEFRTLKKVMDYASMLHLTEKQLNEIVQTKTGETVSALIYKQLILESKRLLNTGISAKEIAYELHFLDPAHFSKFFKSQTGLSPTEFKNVHG